MLGQKEERRRGRADSGSVETGGDTGRNMDLGTGVPAAALGAKFVAPAWHLWLYRHRGPDNSRNKVLCC